MNKDFQFNIGADPEFNILYEDKPVSADKLIATLFRKDHKPDSCDMGYKVAKAGSIGWDGCASTGEIRPAPSKNPLKVVENIRALIGSFAERGRIFRLLTTSTAAPVGGHIHFQVDPAIANKTQLLDNIHKRFISFYLPIQMGEDIIDVRSRTKNRYGQFTDYRVESRDENNEIYTYEFRVPSAEWLTTPRIAQATLAYLATVWNEIVYHPDNFAKSKEILFHTKKQSLALQELAMSQFSMLTRLMLGKIKKHVKRFEYYKEYEKEIDFILSPDQVLAEKERVGFDILAGWQFPAIKEPTKKNLMSETKVKAEARRINVEDLLALVTVPYNPDLNVEQFASALKTRMIAMNWKLMNKYFLFGLRKGVPGYIAMDHNMRAVLGKEHIKTRMDWQEINRTFIKMRDNKMRYDYGSNNPINNAKTIYIGIPYEERINLATKGLINILYNIEKTKPAHEAINEASLFNDTHLTAKDADKIGVIAKIYQVEKISSIVNNNIVNSARERMSEARMMKEDMIHEREAEETADQLTEETLRSRQTARISYNPSPTPAPPTAFPNIPNNL